MKKFIISLMMLICSAVAAYASPVDIVNEYIADNLDDILSDFEPKGFDLRAQNGPKMRAIRTNLDREAKSYAKLSLEELRKIMLSNDKDKSFLAAWTIIRTYIPDGDLRNWREAVYAHSKDFSDGIPPALVFVEAFYRVEIPLIRSRAFWNARELYEQFLTDPLAQIFYYVAPYQLHNLANYLSSAVRLSADPFITPFRTPSPTILPITMAQPGDDQYDKSSEDCIWLNEYGLPTINDHNAAKFIWDTATGKIHKL